MAAEQKILPNVQEQAPNQLWPMTTAAMLTDEWKRLLSRGNWEAMAQTYRSEHR